MKHEMKLNANAFELIRKGEKTIEVRLYDDKRRQIKLGDEIEFSELPRMENKLSTKVTALLIYKDFKSLYSDFPGKDFGGDGWTVDALVENIHEYYSKGEESEFGVLGIKLELIKEPLNT